MNTLLKNHRSLKNRISFGEVISIHIEFELKAVRRTFAQRVTQAQLKSTLQHLIEEYLSVDRFSPFSLSNCQTKYWGLLVSLLLSITLIYSCIIEAEF